MRALYWQARRWMGRLSREGTIGVVLLAVALVFDLLVLAPAHSRLQQLHQLVAVHGAEANSSVHPLRHEPDSAQQLESYYRYFPSEQTTPDWLNKIYRAAAVQKLQLTEGEYRVQRVESSKIIRYHIAVPVEGSYSQIRHFIATVLATVPIASLDHISFERKKIEEPTIDAKITFTLYLAAAS